MAKQSTYIGFSTHNSISPPYTLTDIDLIKQDLLNTFNTKRGERFMMPDFGSNIYLYLFDQMDDETLQAIEEDAETVILGEPRVELVSVEATATEQTVRIEIILNFLPGQNIDAMFIEFNRQNIGEV